MEILQKQRQENQRKTKVGCLYSELLFCISWAFNYSLNWHQNESSRSKAKGYVGYNFSLLSCTVNKSNRRDLRKVCLNRLFAF
jgi:hypothetical protein